MRGMFVLAFGAILIWVGISTAPEPDQADGNEASPPVASSGAGPDVDLTEESTSSGGDSEVIGRAQVEEPQTADPVRPSRRSEPDEGAEAEVFPDEAVLSAEVEASRRVPTMPRTAPVVTIEEQPTFQLGGPLGDAGEAGEVLLDAWTAQDPGQLESYLNDGSGKELPATRRRLIVAFWQSLVGDAEAGLDAAAELQGAEGVTTAQVGLLRASAEMAAGETDSSRAVPADIGRRDSLARAMRMVMLERRGDEAMHAGAHESAARCYSDLLQLELAAPWAPHREALLVWAAAINEAQEHNRLDPRGGWPSIEHEVRPNENLITIRKDILREHPGLKLSAGLLRRVNRVGKWIHPGDVLRVPTETPNVLVDLDARLAVYRHGTEVVCAWEVGIGKEGNDTPTGTFVAGEKQTEPSWMPEGRPSLPYGHPDNPLGTRWIAWFRDQKKTTFGFHGTADPDGVGGRVSQGCIRMRNADVEELFELLPLGSRIVVQP